MDFNEKAFARQKFRSSRGRGRGGRGGHGSGPARQAARRDLESNAFRYEDDADKVDDGIVAPKSQGADLETLIEDADVQFNQAFYRFRAQLHDITEEVPPLGATRPEQLLAIDLQALAASLSALPLHQLLGLEPEYLEGVAMEGLGAGPQGQGQGQQPSRSAAPPSTARPGLATEAAAEPRQVPAATLPGRAAPLAPAAALPRPGIPVPLTDPLPVAASVSSTGSAAPVHARAPVPGPAAAPAPVPTPASAAAAAVSPSAPAGAADDEDDDELNALLMGRAPPPPPHPHGARATQPTNPPSGAAPTWVGAPGSDITRPAGPAMPPVLAAAMAAARPPPFAPGNGPGLAAGAAGPGPGSVAAASAATSTSLQGTAGPTAVAGLSRGQASLPAYAPAASLPAARSGTGGAVGIVRLAGAGPSPGVALPAATGPAATAAAATATPGTAGLPPARSLGVPALAAAQRVAAASSTAAAAGGGGQSAGGSGQAGAGTGTGGALVDDELRLLLGLPAAAAAVAAKSGPPKGGAATAVVAQAAAQAATQAQAQARPVLKATPTAVLPPAATGRSAPPAPQQPTHTAAAAAAKSLDDWLSSL